MGEIGCFVTRAPKGPAAGWVLAGQLKISDVTGIASEKEPHVNDAESCAQIIRRMRCEREHAAIQREIDHLQELGASEHSSRIDALWAQKHELLRRLEGLI